MRIWGRIEGAPQTDSDPLGTPSFVFGFFNVPDGSKVDIEVGGIVREVRYLKSEDWRCWFRVGILRFHLPKHLFRTYARRENDGRVFPDYEQRKWIKMLREVTAE